MHKVISTNNAPKAIGPYSQGILATGTNILFISGQIAPEKTDIQTQTKQVLNSLFAILHEAKFDVKNITKVTIYLKDMNTFSIVNEIYQDYFKEHFPSRVCVEVSRLPKDVLIEIDAIAVKN